MEANFNSFTARLYRWFYFKKMMPENLCPYFWKCVSMYVLMIPYLILSLPYLALDFIGIKRNEGSIDATSLGKPIVGFSLYLLLFLLFCIGFTLITIWTATNVQLETYYLFYAWGILCSLGLLVWGVVAGVKAIVNMIRYRKLEKGEHVSHKSSMVKEYIKAKYKKYCPLIEWKK